MSARSIPRCEVGRLRRFLFRCRADIWGPLPLKRWLWGNDPQEEFFSRVCRDIVRKPEEWTVEPYGLANHKDSVRVYAVDGLEKLTLAADNGVVFVPAPYWRCLLSVALDGHRDWREMKRAEALQLTGNQLVARLIAP